MQHRRRFFHQWNGCRSSSWARAAGTYPRTGYENTAVSWNCWENEVNTAHFSLYLLVRHLETFGKLQATAERAEKSREACRAKKKCNTLRRWRIISTSHWWKGVSHQAAPPLTCWDRWLSSAVEKNVPSAAFLEAPSPAGFSFKTICLWKLISSQILGWQSCRQISLSLMRMQSCEQA